MPHGCTEGLALAQLAALLPDGGNLSAVHAKPAGDHLDGGGEPEAGVSIAWRNFSQARCHCFELELWLTIRKSGTLPKVADQHQI
jgi:hypothetical protein